MSLILCIHLCIFPVKMKLEPNQHSLPIPQLTIMDKSYISYATWLKNLTTSWGIPDAAKNMFSDFTSNSPIAGPFCSFLYILWSLDTQSNWKFQTCFLDSEDIDDAFRSSLQASLHLSNYKMHRVFGMPAKIICHKWDWNNWGVHAPTVTVW